MNKIILYDPSISTLNKGDNIIAKSCIKEIKNIFGEVFFINISTHLPISRKYLKLMGDVNKKFVLGSNLLSSMMNENHNQWDITIENADIIGPVIIMGAGFNGYSEGINDYSKELYNAIFDKNFIHSVRDSYTEQKLKSIGIANVINTGCPTTWELTQEHCREIPINKAKNVICTLTDYAKDYENDKKLLEILEKNYENIYYWVQGSNDYEYIKELNFIDKVKIVHPTLEHYEKMLEKNENIDFVGTRLHGGIKALQCKKRSIIISIDNRAREMGKDINLPIIERNEIDKIEDLINKSFVTDIKINESNIQTWRNQFIIK